MTTWNISRPVARKLPGNLVSSQVRGGYLPVWLLFIALLGVIAAASVYSISVLFGPLLAALLLTLVIKPLVLFFEARGIRRIWVVSGIFLILIILLVFGLGYLIPLIVEEAKHLSQNAPTYAEQFRKILSVGQELIAERFPSLQVPDLYTLLREQAYGEFQVITASLARIASDLLTVFSQALLVPLIVFFFLKDGHLINRQLLRLIPNRYFEMFVLLFYKIMNALQLYIRGQLIDATAVGILTSLGLAVLGFPYALVIGLIAGVGNLIPYLGPILGFIPALLVIIVTPEWFGVWEALTVVSVFVTVQLIENMVIYPLAVGKSVELHPLIVFLGIVVGGQLGGIVGMIIAIPLIAILKVSVETVYEYLKGYAII